MAIELDEGLAEAHASLGLILWRERNMEGTEKERFSRNTSRTTRPLKRSWNRKSNNCRFRKQGLNLHSASCRNFEKRSRGG